jgi:hypothetical protein
MGFWGVSSEQRAVSSKALWPLIEEEVDWSLQILPPRSQAHAWE